VAALDDLLPAYDWSERHELRVAAPPQDAVAAFLAAPVAPGRLIGLLLRLRGLRTTGSVGEALQRMGFEELARTFDEVVVGATGVPWRPAGRIGRFDDRRPGRVRIAVDVRGAPAPGGCVLSTETRICALDAPARRAFGRYWRVIRPFSGAVRRSWLASAARRAESEAEGRTAPSRPE
jgi:hypothetical protein